MPTFSLASMQRLATCDIRLQKIMCEVIKVIDFTVVCGTRNKEDQERAFAEGKSKVHWPNSMHNTLPSLAIDVAPYFPEGIRWSDREAFIYLAGIIKGTAAHMGYTLRWGGDWDSDNDQKDEDFKDLPHFELVN